VYAPHAPAAFYAASPPAVHAATPPSVYAAAPSYVNTPPRHPQSAYDTAAGTASYTSSPPSVHAAPPPSTYAGASSYASTPTRHPHAVEYNAPAAAAASSPPSVHATTPPSVYALPPLSYANTPPRHPQHSTYDAAPAPAAASYASTPPRHPYSTYPSSPARGKAWHILLATSSNAYRTLASRVKMNPVTWRAIFATLFVARCVIRRIAKKNDNNCFNSGLLSYIFFNSAIQNESCDVASNICQALGRGAVASVGAAGPSYGSGSPGFLMSPSRTAAAAARASDELADALAVGPMLVKLS